MHISPTEVVKVARRREYLYLGKSVKDRPPKGLNTIGEVRDIARKIYEYVESGGDRRIANARLITLWLAVQRSTKFPASKKPRAFEEINKVRKRLGFKPLKKFKTKGR